MREKVVQNIYYDREKKTYIVYFNYGKDPSGKYIRKTKTYKDIRTAKRELKNFEAEKVNQELIDPSSVTFKEYAEQWLKYKTASCEDTTIYGYSQFLNKHIYPFMGDMQLQDITTDTINDYIYFKSHCKKKDNPLSLNSIRKHYDLLKQLFDRAVDSGRIKKNPVNNVAPPKKTAAEISVYTAEQLQMLFSIISGTRMEPIVKLAGYLGLRREEICGLKWESVNFEKNVIYINNARTFAGTTVEKGTKSKRSTRVLAMPQDLAKTLKEIKAEHDDYKAKLQADHGFEYVISMENGMPMRPNYVSDCFKKTIDDAHLPHITLHGIRHSFASVANELGIPLYEISTSLGHSNTTITEQIYVKLFDAKHTDTINTVADALATKDK